MTYTEIKGDLFQHFQKIGNNTFILPVDKNIAYAHCIANDGKYGAGIAPIFINQIFQSDTFVKRFLKENPWKGHGWSLCFNRLNGDHYLLEVELITKEFTYGKPTYETITEAIKHLRLECNQYDISLLRIPKIGCGLDGLDWDIVSSIISLRRLILIIMIKILKPFRELKRIISQWIETEYWYRFRKTPHYYLNDETQKYEPSKYDKRARDTLTCTWNGDSDILQMALLKTEHMFYNLKKHSYHQYFYVDSFRFFEEGATDSDRSIFARQVIGNCEKNPKEYKYCWNFHRKELYSDKELHETVTKKDHKHKKYVGFENSWWIGNEEVDKSISDSGLLHYYLYHRNEFDGWGSTTTWGIKRTYDEQIPSSEIPEKNKQYYLNLDDPDLGHEEAPQYRVKKEEDITYFPSCYNWKDIQKLVDNKGIKINVLKSLFSGAQTMTIDDMKVYAKLSPYIKSKARGLRRNLVELLHFRHMLKKLINMSDTDDKYFNMWDSVKDPEEKSKKLEESIALYRQDRKNLYHEIAEFMAENGDSWWD